MTQTRNTQQSFSQGCFLKGFTLIELLVVVLIIGILAAVAVPQYQKAVLKSRFSGVISNTTSIAKALEIYYLENGSYPSSLQDLVISIGGCTTSEFSISCKNSEYYYWRWANNAGKEETFIAGFLTNKLGLGYLQWTQNGNTFIPARAMQKQCRADSTNTHVNQICQSMGGIPDGTSDWHANAFTKSNQWHLYKLPQ